MRRFGEAGFTVATARLDECADEAGVLFANLERRWGVDMSDATARAIVVGLADHLAAESVVFTARRDGQLVGFALAFPYMGAMQAMFGVGAAAGPAVGVLVWQSVKTNIWWMYGLTCLIALAFAWLGMRDLEPVTKAGDGAGAASEETTEEPA